MPLLPVQADENLLVGTEIPDDAAVYRLNKELALIQTVDFFPPVVDDPYYYGQIAAANALSDVYAMGGKPLTAMNIVCFPCKLLGTDVLVEILKGGAAKVAEAGALLVGGHTINDNEPKYGLSVTGIVSPEKILTKGGVKPGDRFILTKPLGTGIITTALKADMVPSSVMEEAVHWMTTLNKEAAEAAREIGVKACTDITGFGLLGHTLEMIRESECGVVFFPDSIPIIEGTFDLAGQGLVPGGAVSNREYLLPNLLMQGKIDPLLLDIFCDPQTSGGLLLAVPGEKTEEALKLLRQKGLSPALVGKATSENKGKIALGSTDC